MALVRLLPPRKGDRPTIRVNERIYTCAQGAAIDVPDMDAAKMMANDWTSCAKTSGPTTARPATPMRSDTHFDATLGLIVVFDGLVWRNPASGAAA